jgi:hypothetical protein
MGCFPNPIKGSAMELIETLTKELGVKQEQARGGVRILFQIVKETLGEEDFYKVARLLPDLEEMATRVPGNGCVEGGWQELTSTRTRGLGTRNLERLAGGFLSLGLDCTMVNRFIPFMVSYVRHKGGDEINSLSERDLR